MSIGSILAKETLKQSNEPKKKLTKICSPKRCRSKENDPKHPNKTTPKNLNKKIKEKTI